MIYSLYSLLEFVQTGLSIRAWWNNLRMARITTINAWLFGTLSVMLKILGISETVFEVTQKDQSPSSDDGDVGSFTFDGSHLFLPGTTLLLVQLTALAMGLIGSQPSVNDRPGSGLGEIVCSMLVLICFWPFVKGLFAKGKYGIPLSTICKAALLALLFVHLCKRTSLSYGHGM